MEAWRHQLEQSVNSLQKLEKHIRVTDEEKRAIEAVEESGRWGTTPYFASLMDPEDPACPIRRQVIPSLCELDNRYGVENYLEWKENRLTDEKRPDCIARQYVDRVAFLVTDVCTMYCRHCFRKELVIVRGLRFRFDIEEGLQWLREHEEVRDVLLTGGDPFILSDSKIAYLVEQLRAIPHLEMIRFHTRAPITLPQRITPDLMAILRGNHRVPIWVNTQCNHAKEITERTAEAVYKLLTCGIPVGNQAVLLKGINDDVASFRELHQKLLSVRIRPYYVFYCEPAPGIDHFRTPVERGAELIRDAIRGHTTGLAQPIYVVATRIGKITLMPYYGFVDKSDRTYRIKNHEGEVITLPNIPE
jgi:lysine 2,3-aminomutase